VNGTLLNRDGVHFNRDLVLELLVKRLTLEMKKRLPDGNCSLELEKIQDGEAYFLLRIKAGLDEPFPIHFSIDRNGTLRGLDFTNLAVTALNGLAAQLRNKKITLSGFQVEILEVQVDPHAHGVWLSGTAQIYGTISV